MRLRFLAPIAAALVGCSSIHHTIEPDPILPAPSEARTVEGFGATDTTVDCSLATGPTGTKLPSEMSRFIQALYCAYRAGPEARDWIQRFVERGTSLSDSTCNMFFNALELRRVESGYAQTNMNITGTAVTAALAATGNHTRGVFNVATALALGNAWFENYKSNYIMTPNLGKLHDKLQEALRRPIADDMKAKAQEGRYTSVDEAKTDVQKYDQLCSHKAIVALLDKSIEAAELERFPIPGGLSPQEKELADQLTAKLYAKASGGKSGTFAPGELATLYAVFGEPKLRKEYAAAAVELDPKLKEYISNLGLNADPVPPEVAETLLALDRLLKLAGSEAVNTARLHIAELIKKKENKAGLSKEALSAQIETEKRRYLQSRSQAPVSQQGRAVPFDYRVVRPSKAAQ